MFHTLKILDVFFEFFVKLPPPLASVFQNLGLFKVLINLSASAVLFHTWQQLGKSWVV